ncbi:6547_t:CDS:2 [Funneliformis geosporum]|nr:6547_t:CDS:2 [Funneliformis geosporum]
MAPNGIVPIMNESTFNLPRLEDYDINPLSGFLPSTPPLQRLTNPYYEPWETLIDIFHELMLIGRLREYVRKLPLLKTDRLENIEEYRRAFLILSFLAHGYVWGKYEPISDRLPPNIAIPWVKVSDYLDVAPICNHAAVVTWNWRLLFSNEPFDLNNLATLITFSNTLDESWFYLVTTAIEGFGGRALTSIMTAIQAVYDGNDEQLINALKVISSTISDINATLQRMFEKCDPYVFYWKVRPYLSGWKNEDLLPRGLIYEGVDENDENGNPIYRQYIGGSAGQSALIQALDIALNIDHYPTGVRPNTNGHTSSDNGHFYNNNCHHYSSCLNGYPQNHDIHHYASNGHTKPQQPYLHRIRQNIPGKHRKFLEDLAKIANIRNYIISNADYDSSTNTSSSDDEDMRLLRETKEASDLIKAYNECLIQMKNFRNKHLQIVSVYIVIQSHKRVGGLHFNAKEGTPPVNKDLIGNDEAIATVVSKKAITNTTSKNGDKEIRKTTSTESIEIIKGQLTKEQACLPFGYVSVKAHRRHRINPSTIRPNVHPSSDNSDPLLNELHDFNNHLQDHLTLGETASVLTTVTDVISPEVMELDGNGKADDDNMSWTHSHSHHGDDLSCFPGAPEFREAHDGLSAIMFSELPNLKNIGLCSIGRKGNKNSLGIRCCNELTEIPAEIGYMKNLTKLDLSKNKLKYIPDTIGFLHKLVELRLSDNQLTYIPSSIGSLKKLGTLLLDNNKLTELPPEIGEIKTLVNLDVRENPITVLPAELGRLQYLRKLRTEGCSLKTEFVHNITHSPPTLMELAARTIVRKQIPILEDTTEHLKDYLSNAKKCSFCGGPYFESFVKRGKIIDKNEQHIPLEYRLCSPHWNTEQERVSLLFCALPDTAPSSEPYKHPNHSDPTVTSDCNASVVSVSTSFEPRQKLQRSSSRRSITIPLSSLTRSPSLPSLPRSASPRPSSQLGDDVSVKKSNGARGKNGVFLLRSRKNSSASTILGKPPFSNSTSRFSSRWRI